MLSEGWGWECPPAAQHCSAGTTWVFGCNPTILHRFIHSTLVTCHHCINSCLTFLPQDDNFVLSAIFCAIEENNKVGLEELLDVAWSIDINQANKHGEVVGVGMEG